MLRISQIKLKCGEPVTALPSKIGKLLREKSFEPEEWRIIKESVDARHKPDISFIYTVDFALKDEAAEERLLAKVARMKGVQLIRAKAVAYELPKPARLPASESERPIIVGFGPCGMFAALLLAEAGLRPIVLERGKRVDERTRDVEHFWQTGQLDTESNVQFGEGGAGTFSDGKLTTGIKDPRIAKVNTELIAAGADPSIAYRQLPHVGTDVLRTVVKNIREKIISLGGEIRFESRLTGIELEGIAGEGAVGEGATDDSGSLSAVTSITINDGEKLDCSRLVLALGNSARDTFRILKAAGIPMDPKPFSVGVRIEHPQLMINESQYGVNANDTEGRLGAAAYKLSHHCENGRGVYTFCMCPGGVVVGAASQEGGVVTNGMSYFARDGKNANSALLVDIKTSDFDDDPIKGIELQERLEQAAYKLGGGGYLAPVQRVGDFLAGRPSKALPSGNEKIDKMEKTGKIENCSGAEVHPAGAELLSVNPTYRPGVTWTDMTECLPDFVIASMREALPELGRKLKGFDMDDAVITGVETRSSCPLRMPRGEDCQSRGVRGVYPAGEGAGYAGGIMSAGVDGIRIAEAIIGSFDKDVEV